MSEHGMKRPLRCQFDYYQHTRVHASGARTSSTRGGRTTTTSPSKMREACARSHSIAHAGAARRVPEQYCIVETNNNHTKKRYTHTAKLHVYYYVLFGSKSARQCVQFDVLIQLGHPARNHCRAINAREQLTAIE